MASAVDLEAARRAFLASGSSPGAGGSVRPQVLRSWERCLRHGIDPDRPGARFVGLGPGGDLAEACAEEVFAAFI